MNIGKACAVFEQINSDKYTDQEKLYAIKQVIDMPAHNGITKEKIIDAFRWFYDWVAEEDAKKQTNADRIRSMTDDELADFIERFGTFNQPCSISKGKTLEWLQSEVEVTKDE